MDKLTLTDWLKYGPHLRWYWRFKHRKIERLLREAYTRHINSNM